MSNGRLEVRPVAASLGAEVWGCDFSRPIDDACFEAITTALLDRQVLIFRDQEISETRQIEFSRRFGEVQIHVLNQYQGANPEIFLISNLDENDRPIGEHPDPGAAIWHTDGSWARVPGHVTMLHALEVPSAGGDTYFANMYAAYDALDADAKARIEDMRIVHDLDDSRRRSGARAQMTAEQRAAAPPVEQPLVRYHPLTGRKSIYLGDHGCFVAGMAEAEGRAFVQEMNAHATRPEFVYIHRWRPRDLVLWDNRCTLHKATDFDFARERRVIRRTTVLEKGPLLGISRRRSRRAPRRTGATLR